MFSLLYFTSFLAVNSHREREVNQTTRDRYLGTCSQRKKERKKERLSDKLSFVVLQQKVFFLLSSPHLRHIWCIFPHTHCFIKLVYWMMRNVEHIGINKRVCSVQTVWTEIFLKSYTEVNWIVARPVITMVTWRVGLQVSGLSTRSMCIFDSCWFSEPWYGCVTNKFISFVQC